MPVPPAPGSAEDEAAEEPEEDAEAEEEGEEDGEEAGGREQRVKTTPYKDDEPYECNGGDGTEHVGYEYAE